MTNNSRAALVGKRAAAVAVTVAMAACMCAAPGAGAALASEDAADAASSATTTDGDTTGSSDVTDSTPAYEVATDKYTMRVNQIIYITYPTNDGAVKYKSSNKKAATVTKTGKVVARHAGKTTITATGQTKQLQLKLTVKKSNFKPVALKKLSRYSYFKKYMSDSQFQKAYNKALKIVLPLGDLNRKQQLMGVASALREMVSNMTYSMSDAHYNDPYGYLVKKTASCAGCTRATGLCLDILGIKYEHVNENQYTHQWARVKVGKTYWICDAYGLYCGEEPGVRQHPYF